jgi:hypothetical protein
MSTYGESDGLVKRILTWLVIGILGIVALRLALVLLGIVFKFGSFAIFTLGPILLVGWLVLKALRYFTRDRSEIVV